MHIEEAMDHTCKILASLKFSGLILSSRGMWVHSQAIRIGR
jgi:hypothetical protein